MSKFILAPQLLRISNFYCNSKKGTMDTPTSCLKVGRQNYIDRVIEVPKIDFFSIIKAAVEQPCGLQFNR